jgi:signal transduction histidine kinase
MAGRALRASPLSLSAVAVILAISIVAFVLTRHSSEQQEKALLQNQTDQGAILASSILDSLGSAVNTVATGFEVSHGSVAEFESLTKSLAGGPVSAVLATHQNGAWVVTAKNGKAFNPGDALPSFLDKTLDQAGATLTPAPVVRDGDASTSGFAVGAPLVPTGEAIYIQITVDPFTATPVTTGRPFESLRVALYGSKKPDPENLFVATTRSLPLGGPVARADVPVGNATWTLLAEAKVPLNGSFAHWAPFGFLLLGILVALMVGGTVEILVRRQRYAAHLVTERTADLEQSLGDLRAAQDALVRSERLLALGEMASVVGHELRNPLTAVTNALFLIRREVGEPTSTALEGHLAMAERETDKAATLASDLTAFVRPRDPVLEEVELGEVVNEVIESTPPPAEVDLDLAVAPHMVRADRHQIAEVVTNLVTNAYQALPEGGSVHVGVEANGSEVALVVEDNGPGIDAEASTRLFEPFFTTKPSGTGLGLAIVRRLVEAHGGTISVRNVDPHGARVEVLLPADGHRSNGS